MTTAMAASSAAQDTMNRVTVEATCDTAVPSLTNTADTLPLHILLALGMESADVHETRIIRITNALLAHVVVFAGGRRMALFSPSAESIETFLCEGAEIPHKWSECPRLSGVDSSTHMPIVMPAQLTELLTGLETNYVVVRRDVPVTITHDGTCATTYMPAAIDVLFISRHTVDRASTIFNLA